MTVWVMRKSRGSEISADLASPLNKYNLDKLSHLNPVDGLAITSITVGADLILVLELNPVKPIATFNMYAVVVRLYQQNRNLILYLLQMLRRWVSEENK